MSHCSIDLKALEIGGVAGPYPPRVATNMRMKIDAVLLGWGCTRSLSSESRDKYEGEDGRSFIRLGV